MSELNVDLTEQEEKDQPLMTNVPLMIALAFAIGLLALFVAVETSNGQTPAAPDVAFGSLRGRVTTASGDGLAGIRVVVRRVHAGPANFHFDRITSVDGTYEIKHLLPGRYTVEVDRRTVPDSVFPSVPKISFADVYVGDVTTAALILERDTAPPAPKTARLAKRN
jgi:hypothetical protein